MVGRLLLDLASDELDSGSSNGAISPESGIGSSSELLTGVAVELLELSVDDGDEMKGTPAESGGMFELLLIFAAEESASSAELLRRSWLLGMSRTLELLDWGSHATSPQVGVGSGSGAITEPDSAPMHAFNVNVEAMPRAVAIEPFTAVESFAFPKTFFFSIFMLDPNTFFLCHVGHFVCGNHACSHASIIVAAHDNSDACGVNHFALAFEWVVY